MTGNRRVTTRGVLVALGACTVGAFALSAPAAADVTVTPAVGIRGDSARLDFRISEERAGAYTTKIELDLPESAPVAEVYPLSVPDWAPAITWHKLDKPIETLDGAGTTQIVSAITWIRVTPTVAGQDPAANLVIELGPLPDASQFVFTVVQTYSDGTVVRWADPPAAASQAAQHPAPVLKLLPSAPDPAAGDEADVPAGTSAGLPYAIIGAVLLIGAIGGLLLFIPFGESVRVLGRRIVIPRLPPFGRPTQSDRADAGHPDGAAEPSDPAGHGAPPVLRPPVPRAAATVAPNSPSTD